MHDRKRNRGGGPVLLRWLLLPNVGVMIARPLMRC